jgi:gluconolactonase
MRSSMFGLSCLSVVGLLACSDDSRDGGVAGSIGVSGGAGVGGESSAAGTSATGPGTAGSSAAPSGGASSGGSGSELGIGGNVELDPSAGAGGGDGQSGGELGGDAGSPIASAVCPSGPFATNPLEGAAEPAIVCDQLTFAEGTVWFAERNQLFFSDFQIGNGAAPGRIMTFTPGGACEEFITDAGTNGLVIAPDGNLLGARHVDQTLTLFDLETRQPSVFVADNGGLAFNSPNDITVRSDGNIYFTDPNYFLAGRASEQPMRAYRRDPSGALTVIDETGTPNGITLSPDETRLYLSHLGGAAGNNILAFDVDAAGAASNPQPFGSGGSDGMGIDCAGNLYTTQNGVQVFSPEGELIGSIAAPGAANVAFGGPDRRTLFIAATTTLLAVELAIPGLPY